jgi:AcrR family transcriptional regulator
VEERTPRRPRIADVAREAGVSKGGLLYHFASKEALLSGLLGRMAEWMRIDLDLADLCAAGKEQRADRVKHGPLAPLTIVWNDPDRLPEAWTAEWQRRLPPEALEDTALAGLAHDLERHLERFQDAGTHEAPQLRSELESRLLATFRRNPLESAAVFAWLGLTALDLERLRGELARRLAFPRARLVT